MKYKGNVIEVNKIINKHFLSQSGLIKSNSNPNNSAITDNLGEDSNDYIKRLITIEGEVNNHSKVDSVTNYHLIKKIKNACNDFQEIVRKYHNRNNNIKTNNKIIKQMTLILKLNQKSELVLVLVPELKLDIPNSNSNVNSDSNNRNYNNTNDDFIIKYSLPERMNVLNLNLKINLSDLRFNTLNNNINNNDSQLSLSIRKNNNTDKILSTPKKHNNMINNNHGLSPIKSNSKFRISNSNSNSHTNSNTNILEAELKRNYSNLLNKKSEIKNIRNMFLCKGCQCFTSNELKCNISYKLIILNHDFKCQLNGNTPTIPPFMIKTKVIYNEDKSKEEDMYYKLRSFDDWVLNEVKVCNECFLENTE